jgi:serine/threonine-protein kinase
VFSPDGQWIAFFSRGSLKKIRVTGGAAVVLASARQPLGVTWQDGRILFGQQVPPAIVEIPETGGAARQLVTLNEKTEQAVGPQLVARGQSILFSLRTSGTEWDDASIVVQDLATGRRSVLGQGSDARALPTGHLVYARAGTIYAVPFDETVPTVAGGPVPIHQGIETGGESGTSPVAWSAAGTFAIAQGARFLFRSSMSWVDREGKEEPTRLPVRNYGVGLHRVACVAEWHSRRSDDLFGRRLATRRARRL